MLATMMLPGQVTMIPVFTIWRAFGLIDTFAPLVVHGVPGRAVLHLPLPAVLPDDSKGAGRGGTDGWGKRVRDLGEDRDRASRPAG